MDYSKFSFFCLNKKEEIECKKKKIPNFYWYYLKALEQGWGMKEIKILIYNKIKNFLFSDKEIENLVKKIAKKIKETNEIYKKNEKIDIKKMEKMFDDEISVLFKNLLIKKIKEEKKKNKKKKTSETINLISKIDGWKLSPTLVFSRRLKATRDEYCAYIEECKKISQKYNARLDCRNCPNQYIEK